VALVSSVTVFGALAGLVSVAELAVAVYVTGTPSGASKSVPCIDGAPPVGAAFHWRTVQTRPEGCVRFTVTDVAAAGIVPVPAGGTRVQLIAVERAALGIARAARGGDLEGRIGFLCDPQPITVRDLASRIAALSGRAARLVSVPNLVVRLLGVGETVAEALTGRSRPFNADKAREILAGDWLCDGRAVDEALALPAPRPLDEGLRALWAWYRRAGWVPNAGL